MKEQRMLEENYLAQQLLWLLNNIHYCYDGDLPTNKYNEKRQHFLQHKEQHKNTKEAYTDESKSMRKALHRH